MTIWVFPHRIIFAITLKIIVVLPYAIAVLIFILTVLDLMQTIRAFNSIRLIFF